jgi:hypothetical protein
MPTHRRLQLMHMHCLQATSGARGSKRHCSPCPHNNRTCLGLGKCKCLVLATCHDSPKLDLDHRRRLRLPRTTDHGLGPYALRRLRHKLMLMASALDGVGVGGRGRGSGQWAVASGGGGGGPSDSALRPMAHGPLAIGHGPLAIHWSRSRSRARSPMSQRGGGGASLAVEVRRRARGARPPRRRLCARPFAFAVFCVI